MNWSVFSLWCEQTIKERKGKELFYEPGDVKLRKRSPKIPGGSFTHAPETFQEWTYEILAKKIQPTVYIKETTYGTWQKNSLKKFGSFA